MAGYIYEPIKKTIKVSGSSITHVISTPIVSGVQIGLYLVVHLLHSNYIPEPGGLAPEYAVGDYTDSLYANFTPGTSETKTVKVNTQPTQGTLANVNVCTVSYDGNQTLTVEFTPGNAEVIYLEVEEVRYQSSAAVTEDISSVTVPKNTSGASAATYYLQHKPKKGYSVTVKYRVGSEDAEDGFTAGKASPGYDYSIGGNDESLVAYDGETHFGFVAWNIAITGQTISYLPDDGEESDADMYGFYSDKSKASLSGVGENSIHRGLMFNIEPVTIPANGIKAIWGYIPGAISINTIYILGIIGGSTMGGEYSPYESSYVAAVNAFYGIGTTLNADEDLTTAALILVRNVTSSSVTISPMSIQVDFSYTYEPFG